MANFNHFHAIAAGLTPKARALVEQTIEAVDQGAQARSRVRTGRMRDGWQHEMVSDTEGTVYNEVPYTEHNEYGTVRIPPQPMLHPALDDEGRATLDAGLPHLLEP